MKNNQDFPKDAEDLILSLLQPNPLDRIGCGSKGPLNDFTTLKAHPFFAGIDFDSITKINPPNLNDIKEKINAFKLMKLDKEKQKKNPEKTQFDKENINKDKIPNDTQMNGIIRSVKEGILKKKSPWFHYNTRKVILDTSPKIEYIDPSTNIKKVNLISY